MQPNWTFLESLARPTLNHAQEDFNMKLPANEPCVPHLLWALCLNWAVPDFRHNMLSKLGRHFSIGSPKEQNKACLIMGKHVCTNEGAVSRIYGGLSTPVNGRTNLKSINRELQLIHKEDRHTHSLHPLLSYTHSDSPQREKRASCKGGRAWSCPGNYLAATN